MFKVLLALFFFFFFLPRSLNCWELNGWRPESTLISFSHLSPFTLHLSPCHGFCTQWTLATQGTSQIKIECVRACACVCVVIDARPWQKPLSHPTWFPPCWFRPYRNKNLTRTSAVTLVIRELLISCFVLCTVSSAMLCCCEVNVCPNTCSLLSLTRHGLSALEETVDRSFFFCFSSKPKNVFCKFVENRQKV